MRAADRRTGRSTTRAARSCQAKIGRAGGWGRLNRAEQLDAVVKAPSFASWLMVTGRITVDAELLSATDLRLGNAARLYCADDHRWFREICARLEVSGADTAVQWNTLAKITAITGAAPRAVRDDEFARARTAITDVDAGRGKAEFRADHGRPVPPPAARPCSTPGTSPPCTAPPRTRPRR